jgi:hypothetical protein
MKWYVYTVEYYWAIQRVVKRLLASHSTYNELGSHHSVLKIKKLKNQQFFLGS